MLRQGSLPSSVTLPHSWEVVQGARVITRQNDASLSWPLRNQIPKASFSGLYHRLRTNLVVSPCWLLSVTECQHPPSSHKHRTQQLMSKTVHFPEGEACYGQWAWKGHEIARWTHDRMPQLPWTINYNTLGRRETVRTSKEWKTTLGKLVTPPVNL